ncbi:hypothetical protein BCAR13_890019 [Paraburkholderia caribensis]|nr:hypothetical protein BCAR13_890019 [Paraburkholderia caribensis]
MHLASTRSSLFVAGGAPRLRASVGYQINLWGFFEKVGTLPIAFIPLSHERHTGHARKATPGAGFGKTRRASIVPL